MASSPPPYTPVQYNPAPRPPPPSGYHQTPSSYAPAPPVFQQQSNNNVVVVGSQPQPSTQVVHHVQAPRGTTYLVLTAVLMVICFLHGNLPAFLCLVPALICACTAEEHNTSGQYSNAKDCGSYALCCNIFSIVYYVLAAVAGVVVVIVYFTVGFGIVASTANDIIHQSHCYPYCDFSDDYLCRYC